MRSKWFLRSLKDLLLLILIFVKMLIAVHIDRAF
jgi:hypothetical protein